MKDGIISARQANEILETSKKKWYGQILNEIQEKLDDALKNEKEYFRVRIPAWSKKDMIVYLRKMGYKVQYYDGEYYTIIFGESMLKELEEKERKKKLKRIARIIAIVIFVAIVYWGYVTYGGIALFIGCFVGWDLFRGHM